MVVFSSLVAEHLLLENRMSRRAIRRLSVVDAVYGMGALIIVGAGFVLWFVVGKPSEFYSGGWIVYTKLALFGAIGTMSIVPTMYFLKERNGDPNEVVEIPGKMKMILRIELTILFLIPLLGVMLAQGVR